ncbi:uncharacterized protein PHALS_14495 [Plasmopara halstedii]|uniref:Uncharacterized protein n=1 Tax=Plasmopara halstedii TaxID=4781 RepID=A0A0N7L3E9_PLAHL|nr:uncharacterized protein PHALS_14495 [Plasmopara halstedii]CEG35683.1 hypothetical protein PHALS_14495 [Plasmopara halstedii]|eukprot:XP_024572052.1 hypothetical protein PHALS_14495 [Plasmopara halstedii]
MDHDSFRAFKAKTEFFDELIVYVILHFDTTLCGITYTMKSSISKREEKRQCIED